MWKVALFLVGGLVLVMLLGWIRAARIRGRLAGLSFDDQMKEVAAWAVQVARKEHGRELDLTPESVELVEEILGELHESYKGGKIPENQVQFLAVRWGAYIGEVGKKLDEAARWQKDPGEDGSPGMAFVDHKGAKSYPVGWCWKRIVEGEGDNVVFKFRLCMTKEGEEMMARAREGQGRDEGPASTGG